MVTSFDPITQELIPSWPCQDIWQHKPFSCLVLMIITVSPFYSSHSASPKIFSLTISYSFLVYLAVSWRLCLSPRLYSMYCSYIGKNLRNPFLPQTTGFYPTWMKVLPYLKFFSTYTDDRKCWSSLALFLKERSMMLMSWSPESVRSKGHLSLATSMSFLYWKSYKNLVGFSWRYLNVRSMCIFINNRRQMDSKS